MKVEKIPQGFHQHCLDCNAESIIREFHEGKSYCRCGACGKLNERSLVFDPKIVQRVDETGEYWHASAGVFIRNPENKFLFFKRSIFPYKLTVPSGHIDTGETPGGAAKRELVEETGIVATDLKWIDTQNIKGDSCRRGSDAHTWAAYLLIVSENPELKINDEGGEPVWLTLDEAKADAIYPVQVMIEEHQNELLA